MSAAPSPADLLLACVVAAAVLVTALADREGRGARGRGWLLAGGLLWSAGLGLAVGSALRGDRLYPGPANAVWALAIPLVLVGICRAVRRPRAGWLLLAVDVAMVCAAWLMMLWQLLIRVAGPPQGTAEDYLRAAALCSCVVLAVSFGLLATDRPSPPMFLLAAGVCSVAFGEAVAAGMAAGARSDNDVLRAALVVLGGVLVVGALPFLRIEHRWSGREQLRASRHRSVATVLATVLPLVVVVVTVQDSPSDLVSRILGVTVLMSFGLHEAFTRHRAGRWLERLSSIANVDPLTGLGNRRALTEALHARAEAGRVALLNLDIDRFQDVNRQIGHGAGDRVLKAVARVLQDPGLGQGFRLGGDEFALLTTLPTYEALAAAERVRTACAAAMAEQTEVAPLATTVCIGVAGWDGSTGDDPMEVLNLSALALRRAKQGRDQVRLFADEDAAEMQYRDALEQCLRQALAERAIEFFYQPIVRLSDARAVSVESLARWRDPVLGVVAPSEFIDVAEETGLIHDLGMQSMEAAVQLAARLERAGTPIPVAVNVSPSQLRRPGFAQDVAALLSRHAVDPSLLGVEVTEGVYIDLDDPATGMLDLLAQVGVSISIDDFGTGYSSLGYITRLPASCIKIDRTLTQSVEHPRSRSIVSAILGMAAAHDLTVVLEGVETQETAERLAELGAQLAQGWLYSQAVAAEHLPRLIAGPVGPSALAPVRRIRAERRPGD